MSLEPMEEMDTSTLLNANVSKITNSGVRTSLDKLKDTGTYIGCHWDRKELGIVFTHNKPYIKQINIKDSYVPSTYSLKDKDKTFDFLKADSNTHVHFVPFRSLLDKEPRPTLQLPREKVIQLSALSDEDRSRLVDSELFEECVPAIRIQSEGKYQIGLCCPGMAALTDIIDFLYDTDVSIR